MSRSHLAGLSLLALLTTAPARAADLNPSSDIVPAIAPAWAVAPERGAASQDAAFAQALWDGADDAPSGARLRLESDTTFAASLGQRARLVVALRQAEPDASADGLTALATSFDTGFSLRGRAWRLAATYDVIDARNPLLGPLFSRAGLLDPEQRHRSQDLGVTAALQLRPGLSLAADVTVAQTSLAASPGLTGERTRLTARGFGLALRRADLWAAGDQLSLSARKPLPVLAWTEQMALSDVDCDGYPTAIQRPLAGARLGDETDIALGYARPAAAGQLSADLAWRSEADNIRGLDDVALRLAQRWRF